MLQLNISCTFEIIPLEKKNTSPKKRKRRGKFWELTKTD